MRDVHRRREVEDVAIGGQPVILHGTGPQGLGARLGELFEPLLLEGGVTAVFAGHDHNYQHHLVKGIHHIVTGGGGAPLYEVDPIPDARGSAEYKREMAAVYVRRALLEAFAGAAR